MSFARLAAYAWTAPTTLVGLIFIPLAAATGGHARAVRGVIEVHGGAVSFFLRRCTILPGGAAALTLGHVVLGVDRLSLDQTREHERVHVRQAERWGPLFIPAYFAASIVAWIAGGHFYRDNAFEREAYAKSS